MSGLQTDSTEIEALNRMPMLQILIPDGIKTNTTISALQLPRLVLLSWRGACAPLLPFDVEGMKSAVVLDILGGNVKWLPRNLQACFPRFHVMKLLCYTA